MIRAGESSGNLDLVLQRLAVFLEDQNKLQGKVIGAMIYPLLMLFMARALVSVQLLSVVSTIPDDSADQRRAVPLLRRGLLAASSRVRRRRLLSLIPPIPALG